MPELHVVVRRRDPPVPLNRTSCYLSAVEIVQTLALDNYDGDMDVQVFHYRAYPDVTVTFIPTKTLGLMKRSYALFGFVDSTNYMIQYDYFGAMLMELQFRSSLVGWIKFEKTEQHSVTATESKTNVSQNLETTNDVLLNPNGTSNLATASDDVDLSDPSNARFKVLIDFVGGPLPLVGIMVAVLAVMSEAGEHSRTEHLEDRWRIQLTLWDVRVVVDRFGGQPWTTPPFFDYEWLIKAMVRIPKFMYSQRMFNEARMVLELDGLPIGYVEIQRSVSGEQIASTSRRE